MLGHSHSLHPFAMRSTMPTIIQIALESASQAR